MTGAVANLQPGTDALVVYGEPQSGKTEMMICLTARLLDIGTRVIVHLLNDSVDLLTQNLQRFRQSQLSPAPMLAQMLPGTPAALPREMVIFCKKNRRDLERLMARLRGGGITSVLVIDDEADYATPNARVNAGEVTRINGLVRTLLGPEGRYIGVTATPARLDLNNTFNNATERWVRFPAHGAYDGQDTFFPQDLSTIRYRLRLLPGGAGREEARTALIRFLVTAAFLNVVDHPERPENYTMLVHTSGRQADHQQDMTIIQEVFSALDAQGTPGFDDVVQQVYETAQSLYPGADARSVTRYVVATAARKALIVLNSARDRMAWGSEVAVPTSPFTVIVGGNIISRGVTFPNLLAMFFTRDVRTRLQQDTYIQRARMFGVRGAYLPHFELTIPQPLFEDWRRCFVYHRLSLNSIDEELGAPVWLGDARISVASSASIDHSTVNLDKGEMSFALFDLDAATRSALDELVRAAPSDAATLERMSERVGEASLPQFLINFVRTIAPNGAASLAIHTSSSVAGYAARPGTDLDSITRRRGFMGRPQLEEGQFPNAVHHFKIFYNAGSRARVFYKYTERVTFTQNQG